MNPLLTRSGERFGFHQPVPDQLLTLGDLGGVTKPANFVFSSYKSTVISITGKEFLFWIDGRGLGSDFSAPCSVADCRAVKLFGLNLYISPVPSLWLLMKIILPGMTNNVFRLVQDAGNLNFVFLCRGKMILIQVRLYSERVMCASSFGVMSGSVVVSVWHQTPSWYDSEVLPQCIIVSLEEGYSTVPQVLLFHSFVFVCVHQMSKFCENTTSVLPEFPFVLAADKGFIWWIAE